MIDPLGLVKSPLGETARMSELVDITMTRELPLMDPKEYNDMHKRFIRCMHRPDIPTEEPSIHQMTAILSLVAVMSCYVDFAISGPQIRTARAFRCTALVSGPRNTMIMQEL